MKKVHNQVYNSLDLVKKGDILLVDFGSEIKGSEQGGVRPAIVVQNDIGNKYSTTTIVVPVTSKAGRKMPTHYKIEENSYNGVVKDSLIMCEQIKTIEESRIIHKMDSLSKEDLKKVNACLRISLNLL